jgi:hypothetical protein
MTKTTKRMGKPPADPIFGTQRPKPAPLTEAELRAKLDAARQRLRTIVILGMKTWLPEETRKGLAKIESYARGQVRVHYRLLESFRKKWRADAADRRL